MKDSTQKFCRSPNATALIQRVDYFFSFGLWKLRVAQGWPASLRALFPTGATAQQADTVVPIHLVQTKTVYESVH
jgi:hypothetical protein